MIIYVMVIISSNFLHRHIPLNNTWLLMHMLSHQVKLYVKEPFYFLLILIIIIMLKKLKKSINTIVYVSKIINGNVHVICYGWNYIAPQCFRSVSRIDYNNLSPLHIPMK